MVESLFEELKRYVGFDAADEAALRALRGHAAPEFERIATVFYDRILNHEDARRALEGGESQVGRLKVTLVPWMDQLLTGPWDEAYFERRCRIGRVHVRIALPQHYMFGAMNVVRRELSAIVDRHYLDRAQELAVIRSALGKILDLELAIMLHTYREDLLAQQARSERLATFGQLVGSIGHELRNPLGVIETSLYILKGRASEDERSIKHLERIGQQVGIANSIISSLLELIRDTPLTRERVALQPLIEDAASALTLPPGVQVDTSGLAALPDVEGDRGQLRQIFMNLLENAVHAVSPAGTVWVAGTVRDEAVEISVEDTGPGVDPSIRRRLFEPLITTKQKGIGLGLALVRRIVERHGGSIGYTSGRSGQGARFTVRLPTRPGS